MAAGALDQGAASDCGWSAAQGFASKSAGVVML